MYNPFQNNPVVTMSILSLQDDDLHIAESTDEDMTIFYDNSPMKAVNSVNAIAISGNKLLMLREHRIADTVFNCTLATVAILISFGIGCSTSLDTLKQQLGYPLSLAIGFCCQFIFMPIIAFGIAMLLQLDNDMRFGLLCVACVPGGGMGHVAVIIAQTDLPLSVTMNMISVVSTLGTAPLWIFVLGQYFHTQEGAKVIPIYNIEIWLAASFFAYAAGLLINRFKQSVAEGILMWVIKPMLLLSAILFVTVGVYINMYVFEVVNSNALLGAILLPISGFIIGYILAKACRQSPPFIKSIAYETSSMNCLIIIAALRFSLPQYKSDLATVIPVWVMFSVPGLYVGILIIRAFRSCVCGFLETQKQKQHKTFTLASGLINQANMTTLSAPLFVSDAVNMPESQLNSNEKVTSL